VLEAKIAARLEGEPQAAVIRGRLLELLGVADGVGVKEGSFWAVRRLLETMSRKQPLIVVFDDLTPAHATTLDLIEDLAEWARDAPILLLCLARPELCDKRPILAGGRWNATTLRMRTLSSSESARLVENLLGGPVGSATLRDRLLELTDGNPLFLEELLNRLIEDEALRIENGHWVGEIPATMSEATMQAVLESRIDALAPELRAVLQDAAIEGKVFHQSAVEALSAPSQRDQVDAFLRALMREDLIRPDHPDEVMDEIAFRFRHGLIREVVYERLPMATRATQHERFADWLELVAGDRSVEFEEVIGSHLAQAFRYRRDLEPLTSELRALAQRAGIWLTDSGQRALGRGDGPAAAQLLRRAVALHEDGGGRPRDLLLHLGIALVEAGAYEEAHGTLTDALRDANALADPILIARLEIELSSEVAVVDPAVGVDEMYTVARRAKVTFDRRHDDAGIARALYHEGQVHWTRCRCGEMEHVLEQALEHANAAGDRRQRSQILGWLGRAIVIGPHDVTTGITRCREIADSADDDVTLMAVTRIMLGMLEAMRGEFDAARSLYLAGRRPLDELGLSVIAARLRMYGGIIELIAGRPDAAEAELRGSYVVLERIGERRTLTTIAALLARACLAQGKLAEASDLTRASEDFASRDDVVSRVIWLGTRSAIRAQQGDGNRAEALAREAVELASRTDFLVLHGDALADLARVEGVLQRPEDADDALTAAASLYRQKGSEASIRKLERIQRSVPVPSGRG
jgi:tetratricopeptide (TPR) repeat protein